MAESFAAGLVGIVLDDRYRLDALLGEGGMGAVFRAHHLAMDRKVAVKLLKPHLTSDQAALQRFAREARSTMRVDSEHAVKVLDFGVTPGRDYYMVLEYLDGRTVQRELDIDGPFEPRRAVHIARQALRALGTAHASGLIHRDVKPDNLLLMRVGDDADYVKVLDFGVAKLMDGAARSARSALAITQAGMVFGTPEFMSPEQACGQTLDARSDLYSLAATMFAMLTGCGMFKAASPIQWLTQHARTPPPHLVDGASALAPYHELDRVLQRCLAKRREDRPQTADEMGELLAAVEPTLTTRSQPITRQPRASGFSASSYIAAIDASPTLPPAQPAKRSDAAFARTMMPGEGVTTTGVAAQVSSSRRGVWLVLGVIAIVGVIVTTIVLAVRKPARGGPRQAGGGAPAIAAATAGSRDGGRLASPAIAGAAAGPGSAASSAGATISGSGSEPTSAASATPTGSAMPAGSAGATGSGAPARPQPRGRPEVVKLLAEAEDAQRTGNHLRQVVKADAALHADPRNLRARFLLGDGLIASGDLDRGCKYLHELKRNSAARARAHQAGCPTD